MTYSKTIKINSFSFIINDSTIELTYVPLFNNKNCSNIIFCHANGYSAQTYLKLLNIFYENNFNVFGLNFCGHNGSENYDNFSDWYFFRDQILQFTEHLKTTFQIKKFHLIGHSLGGASSLLASSINNKDILSVSCWDPVVLTPFISFLANFIEAPLAPVAEKRRDEFKSLKIIERSYRMSPSFKNWDEEVFQDYLHSCFYHDKHSNTYKLCLPKEIEAKIFRSLKFGHWKYYKKIQLPIFIYTTKKSNVCPIRACKLLIKNNKKSKFLVHPSGSHFFPMEDPINTAQHTLEFIKGLG
ncbi:MAG: alpha/beta hydrolase [Leptospiraceae bacterium]|nr:MAG: alpha/beta hydrolase [Leptospiraceae bacterium]